jgi:hypothetical protein
MSERSLPLTKVVRLASGELAQSRGFELTPPMIALAVLVLVGTAWWAASGD